MDVVSELSWTLRNFFCNVCCLFVCLVSSHEPQLTQIRSKSTKSTKLGKSHKARFRHFHTFPGSCLLFLVSRDLESKNSRKVRQKLGKAVKDRLTFCWWPALSSSSNFGHCTLRTTFNIPLLLVVIVNEYPLFLKANPRSIEASCIPAWVSAC